MYFRVPGPCTVTWGGSSAIKTKAGITVRSIPNWVPIIDDEHGAEPADYIWAGRTITVECIGVNVEAGVLSGMFANTFGAGKAVGEIISGENVLPKALQITERDGSIWLANNTEPLPSALVLAATRELDVPLTFMILFDSAGRLFNSIPSYIVS